MRAAARLGADGEALRESDCPRIHCGSRLNSGFSSIVQRRSSVAGHFLNVAINPSLVSQLYKALCNGLQKK